MSAQCEKWSRIIMVMLWYILDIVEGKDCDRGATTPTILAPSFPSLQRPAERRAADDRWWAQKRQRIPTGPVLEMPPPRSEVDEDADDEDDEEEDEVAAVKISKHSARRNVQNSDSTAASLGSARV